jgi:hypothetical protein
MRLTAIYRLVENRGAAGFAKLTPLDSDGTMN